MLTGNQYGRRLLLRSLLASSGVAAVFVTPRTVSAQGTPPASPAASPVAGDSPVGRQLTWVVDTLNSGAAPAESEVEEHVAPSFLEQAPASELAGFLGQVAAEAPFEVAEYTEGAGGVSARALLTTGTGGAASLEIAVEPAEPHLIVGLLIQPATAGTPVPLASWAEFDQEWAALAPSANFLAAEIVDGECVPVHALNPDLRLGVGSVFKLYILGELARQVREGMVAWDDPLAIRDEWRVPFSGDMNQLPAGEERSLRQYAEQMISVSDNTATDHLLFHLGRQNVEAIPAEMGHDEPEVNIPMLSTYELFKLKLVTPEDLLADYLAAPDEEQRALLESEIAGLSISPEEAGKQQAPIMVDELEWFMSPEEICRALMTLEAWSHEPGLEPITEILAINPGLELDTGVWPYIGFKGGSELGVLNGSWLLRHADGRLFVMTAGLVNPEAPINEPAAFQLMQAAAQLLGSSVA